MIIVIIPCFKQFALRNFYASSNLALLCSDIAWCKWMCERGNERLHMSTARIFHAKPSLLAQLPGQVAAENLWLRHSGSSACLDLTPRILEIVPASTRECLGLLPVPQPNARTPTVLLANGSQALNAMHLSFATIAFHSLFFPTWLRVCPVTDAFIQLTGLGY